ncbi:MAG: PAS domain S-box protein [Deltaproteobacteria bacterium]|nr:PAS domain S-box protein [Deltaproteobacteria bacterium]
MPSRKLIAVIDADGRRRDGLAKALHAGGYAVLALGRVGEIGASGVAPDALVLGVRGGSRTVAKPIRQLRADVRLAAAPIVCVCAPGSGLAAEAVLSQGADDLLELGGAPGALCARVRARLRAGQSLAPAGRRGSTGAMALDLVQQRLLAVARRCAELFGIDRVSIVLSEDEASGYVVASSDDENVRDLPIALESYPEIRQALATRQPVVIADSRRYPLFAREHTDVPKRFRSLALLPVVSEDRPAGVLFLRSRGGHVLGEDDVALLRTVPTAAGLALRGARLLERLAAQSRRSREHRVAAEQQLESLRRYADFFASAADGIVVIDLDGRLLFCNPAACRIFGRSAEELGRLGLGELLAPDGRPRLRQLRQRFPRGLFAHDVDLPIRRGDGQRRVLSTSFSRTACDDRGIVVSLRDVTQERALARELHRTKEFLQRVIDSSADAIVSADMDGIVLLFNPAAEQTYGYAAADVVGKMNVRQLYPAGVAQAVMRHIRSPEHGGAGRLQGYRTELLGKSGEIIPVLLSAALIYHRRRAIGSVGVFRDLRQRIEIEARLQAAQQQLAVHEKNALIAELAGATAHELNQPLTAVMGLAELLLRRSGGDARSGDLALAIVREAERMADIVRKIGKLMHYETKSYVGEAKIIDLDRAAGSEPPGAES